jgi:hypothetical protein
MITKLSAGHRHLIGAVVTGIALLPFFLYALNKVLTGHGADVYRSAYGMLIHWSSVVVLFAVLLASIVGSFLVRWWQLRQKARLEQLIANASGVRQQE